MALYEVGIVLTTTLDDQEREAFLGELRALLAAQKAEIVKQDVWGKRNLAYEIRHQREGFYVFWQFEGGGPAVKALEYKLRLSDPVLRYLTLNLDQELRRSRKMEQVRARQKAAKAAKEAAAPAGEEA
ncbi:MAG TPA: 30S ribosomal protein S6 [Thermoanaerobaculaceae bacterium]|mgnify:FL=1|nr:30S ribosomal protein S6 [Thermoanaerobaculaceae bacterium]HRS15055.1 30S ribosomal protein S6 [Thermoanaerobaculaceae bacterium]